MIKYHKIVLTTLCVVLVSFLSVFAADNDSGTSSSEELTLELKEGSQDEWELRNQNGNLLGIVRSREQDTFKIYNSTGSYKGFVYESEKLVPKDARQKRQFRISAGDIKLYLDILKAVGSASVEPQELTLKPKENVKGEWELQNQSGEIAGTVKKAETGFRFYDSGGKFMGFISPSGSWLPKLGINRREMRITPEQAQFSLDVFKAISSIK
jgi:hypothetical protein